MSLQISYKKQFIFGLMLLAITLAIVEGIVNIWWHTSYACEFENNDLFEDLDDETKKQLCLENLELQHTDKKINPYQGKFLSINSHGFRGPEISLEKPGNTYRIFVIGGSTTFGSGVKDNETIPSLLQEKFHSSNLDFNVQIINAGIPGLNSEGELQIIKTRLVSYNPDLFIVYDGANELWKKVQPDTWKERVIDICSSSQKLGIDTIIILQPLVGTGNRPLTDQELKIYQKGDSDTFFQPYQEFAQKLPEVKVNCTKAEDWRRMFDTIFEPVFFDRAHLNAKGNNIVAENMYQLSYEIVLEKSETIKNSYNEILHQSKTEDLFNENNKGIFGNALNEFEKISFAYKTPRAVSYFLSSFDEGFTGRGTFFEKNEKLSFDSNLVGVNLIGVDLRGKDFSGLDMEEAIFFGADLRYANFTNSNLKGADFRQAILNGISLEGSILSDTDFSQTDLSWLNLSELDLSNSYLNNTKLIGTNLTNANLKGITISHSDLSVSNLQGANLKGAVLTNSDFSVANLQGTDMTDTVIINSVMHVVNFTDADLTNSKFLKTDLFGSILENTIIHNTDFIESNLVCEKNPICA